MGRGEAWKTQIRRLGEVKFEGGEGGEKELRKEERGGFIGTSRVWRDM